MELEVNHINDTIRIQSTRATNIPGPTVPQDLPSAPYETFVPLYGSYPTPQVPKTGLTLALERVAECRGILSRCEQAGFFERCSPSWKRKHRACLRKVAEAEYDAMKYTDHEAWAETEATLDPSKAIERSKP